MRDDLLLHGMGMNSTLLLLATFTRIRACDEAIGMATEHSRAQSAIFCTCGHECGKQSPREDREQ
jgi:hypothetical protein